MWGEKQKSSMSQEREKGTVHVHYRVWGTAAVFSSKQTPFHPIHEKRPLAVRFFIDHAMETIGVSIFSSFSPSLPKNTLFSLLI